MRPRFKEPRRRDPQTAAIFIAVGFTATALDNPISVGLSIPPQNRVALASPWYHSTVAFSWRHRNVCLTQQASFRISSTSNSGVASRPTPLKAAKFHQPDPRFQDTSLFTMDRAMRSKKIREASASTPAKSGRRTQRLGSPPLTPILLRSVAPAEGGDAVVPRRGESDTILRRNAEAYVSRIVRLIRDLSSSNISPNTSEETTLAKLAVSVARLNISLVSPFPLPALGSQLPFFCRSLGSRRRPSLMSGVLLELFNLTSKMENSPATGKRKVSEQDTVDKLSQPSKSQKSEIAVKNRSVSRTCIHEVAVPDNYNSSKDETIHGTLESPIYNGKMAKTYPFVLDPFQQISVACLERNESVLVSAHTSAGKTAVAEYAIAMSFRDKQRVIYTSPLKALSNQKYRELNQEFSDVGLMTGDVTLAPHANCLVMTTEILRGMLYRGSELLKEVAWVIFDEIHYMKDRERGVVWEETIIFLPPAIKMVFLSATMSNSTEFAEWICKLHRQPCHVVYTDFRPTPLQHYVFPMGGSGLYLVVDENEQFKEDTFAKLQETFTKQKNLVDDYSKNTKMSGRIAKGGTASTDSDMYKIVKMIMERQYQPVIIFSFSRRECEQNALCMAKLDFNIPEEKDVVEQVFQSAILCLNEEDRMLPAIQLMLPLLQRGIAVHHSGLLPIIKELVELLFQEGLVKALFATETFALGLNMPAKTVVFTSVKKWDGDSHRYIGSGEYIQMSGRAGRRGKDERGICIIMINEKMEMSVLRDMVLGKPAPLVSTFRLSYYTILNLMSRAEGQFTAEHVIRNSFHQFQYEKSLPDISEKIAKLEKEVALLDSSVEAELAGYHNLGLQIAELERKIMSEITRPERILYYLVPGRLELLIVESLEKAAPVEYLGGEFVYLEHSLNLSDESLPQFVEILEVGFLEGYEGDPCGPIFAYAVAMNVKVRDGGTDWGWGVVVNVVKKPPAGVSTLPAELAASRGSSYLVDTLLHCSLGSSGSGTRQKPFLPRPGERGEMHVVPVPLPLISGISNIRISLPADLRPSEARQTVLLALQELHKQYLKGLPRLNPVKDMGIEDPEVTGLVHKMEELEQKLVSHPLHKSGQTDQQFKCFQRKAMVNHEIQQLKSKLRNSQLTKFRDELKNRSRVLKMLGHTDADGVVQLKGRAACLIDTGDELLVTELMFNGTFNDLDPHQVAALASCFIPGDKSNEQIHLRKELAKPLQQLQDSARKIAEIQRECKLDINVEEYVESTGATFAELMQMTDIFEGSVIRLARRLDEFLNQLKAAAHAVGEVNLEKKFEAASESLRRGEKSVSSLRLFSVVEEHLMLMAYNFAFDSAHRTYGVSASYRD
ncbi:DEAD-box ATP-dependent RNA helicase ISE2, chloroplastic [Apostasia shenzhenica]|uniref:DEAD-box ATP-dependent RNA helicase ISE2, chloroplastic n=1 Tax=Apostasia shenzhenica TaxID=1088818 RepID=A0A2I0AIL0_9ASPA|nr:DEAD-box ATP-dependent RNA helicase ISE2, chloroplastic [Apostasia shenzhenica]